MNDSPYTFRMATTDDAEALCAIYAPYIDTTITFEYDRPATEEFRKRIAARDGIWPYIVCEENGTPVGYAYASRMYERKAYDWAVELSVYLDVNHRGRGLGRSIYGKLIDLLALQGVRTVFGKVTSPNERSDKLHSDMGFERVGTLKNSGFKLGGWRDVSIWEKEIGSFQGEPEPVTPIAEVDAAAVAEVLAR